MNIGTHYIGSFKVVITEKSKPEDYEWLFKKHPNAREVIDNNSPNSSDKNNTKPKSKKGK